MFLHNPKMKTFLKRDLEIAIKSHIDSQSSVSQAQYAISVKLEENVLDQISCKGLSKISIPANLSVSLSH